MDRTKAVAFTLTLCLLTACTKPDKIVIGSKNFTEQLVLGEIVAQQIERTLKIPVDRKLNLGGTMLAQQALISGSIDLYPEYTGTALTAILKERPQSDPAAVFEKVRSAYAQRFHLAWLRPFGFNNTFAMVVRREENAKGITTLSQAAAAKPWKLGVGYEFMTRPDGYPGLVKAYGLRTESAPVTMDLGLLYTALGNRQVDMVAGNSTDGVLSVIDAVVLEDDKKYFPPYECAVVVREQTLERYPTLRNTLEQLSGRISPEIMRKLNHQIDSKHRSFREVASEFLQSVQ